MSTLSEERAQSSNELGFNLLARLLADDAAGENVFFSPFSISIALAMAYNGASHGAKEALRKILGLTDSCLEDLNEANATLLASQEGLDAKVELAMANSIWVKAGCQLDSGFVEQIDRHYAGKVANLDASAPAAAKEINRWVAQHTHDKIKDLLTPADVAAAILVLVNAIYFKGSWTHRFSKWKTKKRPFTGADGSTRKIPMMSRSGHWQYAETDVFQAVALPYGEGRIQMHVLLPKERVPLRLAQEHLDSTAWQGWLALGHSTEGEVVLPRFKARYHQDLVRALVALGGKGFIRRGFPGIGVGDLAIGAVVHEATLEVNEEGSEAAAATAVVMLRGGPSESFRMVVDRPFFCAIHDSETGAILFMGWILDPA